MKITFTCEEVVAILKYYTEKRFGKKPNQIYYCKAIDKEKNKEEFDKKGFFELSIDCSVGSDDASVLDQIADDSRKLDFKL